MLQKIKQFNSYFIIIALGAALFMSSCSDNNGTGPDLGPKSVTSPFLICAGRNPGGVGIDLDSSKAYELDDNPDFDCDLKIQNYKGVSGPSDDPKFSGRPYIALKGTTVSAYNWSETSKEGTMGQDVYDDIVRADVTNKTFTADQVADIDISAVDKVESGDYDDPKYEGKYFYSRGGKNGLKQEYTNLQIGDRWKTGAGSEADAKNTDHTDDPIYIIKSDKDDYFKFMIRNIGGKSDLGEGGYIDIVWEKL